MDGPLGKYRLITIIFLQSLYLNKDIREAIKLLDTNKESIIKISKLTFWKASTFNKPINVDINSQTF